MRLAIPDRGSGFGPSTALVYLPPQYFAEPALRFPVVYLLHGSPGTPADWIRGGGADATGAALAVRRTARGDRHAEDEPSLARRPGVRRRHPSPGRDAPAVRRPPDGRQHAADPAGPARPHHRGDVGRWLLRPQSRPAAPGRCSAAIVDMSGLVRPTHSGGPLPCSDADRPAAAAEPRTIPAATRASCPFTCRSGSGWTPAARTPESCPTSGGCVTSWPAEASTSA